MTNKKSHIVLICSRLDLPGGIERAVVNTANLFAENGHTVTLVIADETSKSFYPISRTIGVVQQPLFFGITSKGNVFTRKTAFASDVVRLRKILKSIGADLVIASEYHLSIGARLATPKKNMKVFSWEHHHYHGLKRNYFWEKLFHYVYPRLDAIVCLNKDEQELFAPKNKQCVVIPNFLPEAADADLDEQENQVLTIARLNYVKGIDLLLPIAGALLKRFPDWKWKIIGDGILQDNVTQFIADNQLEGQLILLPPQTHEISRHYKEARLFVMTSRNECFPMTLLEAMQQGLPCIAFDCQTGPRHIIENGKNGWLIEKENATQMLNTIATAIENASHLEEMSKAAKTSVSKFSGDRIYRQWKQLFDANR